MKLQFWSIGKAHDSQLKDAINDFTQRIGRYIQVEWKTIPPPKNAAALTEQALKKAEGETILSLMGKDDWLVLLDETGRQLTSPQLAQLLEQRALDSTKMVVFLIGGAFGVDEAVKKRANFCWSLSPLVFPHMIARLLLAEQVYRAYTILNNEKYHHI